MSASVLGGGLGLGRVEDIGDLPERRGHRFRVFLGVLPQDRGDLAHVNHAGDISQGQARGKDVSPRVEAQRFPGRAV